MEAHRSIIAGISPSAAIHAVGLAKTLNKTPHLHRTGLSCPACEALEMSEFGTLTFAMAFPAWLENHKSFIAPRTYHDYRQYGAALGAFFGEMQLKDIGFGNVRAYQIWRSRENGEPKGYEHGAGNCRIKNEINGVLKPILREADVWQGIKDKKFKHLPMSREGSGTVLNRDEQRQLLAVAFSDPRWRVAAHCLQIMFRSGCGFGEIRRLRRRDVDLAKGRMTILVGAKNKMRVRTLVLTSQALDSLTWIIKRWEKKGGTEPGGYILPHRTCLKMRQQPFDRPMATIHWAWKSIVRKWVAGDPEARRHKANMRVYDARVTAASLLLQNGKLSLATIEKALGWCPSSAMRRRYYKPDEDMLREALNTLEDNPNET